VTTVSNLERTYVDLGLDRAWGYALVHGDTVLIFAAEQLDERPTHRL
jgi:hypothetical protein